MCVIVYREELLEYSEHRYTMDTDTGYIGSLVTHISLTAEHGAYLNSEILVSDTKGVQQRAGPIYGKCNKRNKIQRSIQQKP